jgi:hypothetical protein
VDNAQPLSPMKALVLLSTLQSADIVLPTTEGRESRLRRITEPLAALHVSEESVTVEVVGAADRARENVCETPFRLAVSTAVVLPATAVAVAVKVAVAVPAATVTDAGTATLALLLERATARPPAGADPLSCTLQPTVPGVVRADDAQLRDASEGGITITAVAVDCPLTVSVRFAVC